MEEEQAANNNGLKGIQEFIEETEKKPTIVVGIILYLAVFVVSPLLKIFLASKKKPGKAWTCCCTIGRCIGQWRYNNEHSSGGLVQSHLLHSPKDGPVRDGVPPSVATHASLHRDLLHVPAFRDVIDVPLVVRRLHKSRKEPEVHLKWISNKLKLKLAFPMPAFRDVIDVPLVVRRLHKSRKENGHATDQTLDSEYHILGSVSHCVQGKDMTSIRNETWSWSDDVLPFVAMLMLTCMNMGLLTIVKAVMNDGFSTIVFIVYQNVLETNVDRSPPTFRLLFTFFILGLLGSPTMGSAISNLGLILVVTRVISSIWGILQQASRRKYKKAALCRLILGWDELKRIQVACD
ncbi:hypothetical protein Tco_0553687 [Tanacetum coccineum]